MLTFYYDDQGAPVSVELNGTRYYYHRNLQGDVIGLYIYTGAQVVSYTYDPWGKLLNITDTSGTDIGTLNPLRYRGYYYDTETGFYFLQSRYYDPTVGRFINVDGQLSGVGGDMQGYNLFAYCQNDPVNLSDNTGHWPRWATIAVGALVATAAIAATIATMGAAAPAAVCTLTSIGMSLGASYTVASVAASTAVAATIFAASAYAGDIAYSSVTGESYMLNTIFRGNTEAYNAGLAITSMATAGVLEAASRSPGVCFVEGTPVLTACGYIAIEKIKEGDMVWSEDPETGEKTLKQVVKTFVNQTNELVHVWVNSEEIIATPEHPFYLPQKGWTAACRLRAGDILILQDGRYAIVEKIQHEILETPVTVYNFEVADFHTYYVGLNSVLVHNTCGGKPTSPNQMQNQVKRGQAPKTVVRVDNPTIKGQLPHVHFSDGTALNIDGSVHDAMNGIHTLTKREQIWLFENGWGG